MSKEDQYQDIPEAEGFSINANGVVIDSDGEEVSHIMVGKTKKFRLNVDGTIRTFKADELVAELFGEGSEEEEETPEEDEAAEKAAKADAEEESTEEEEKKEDEPKSAVEKAVAKKDEKPEEKKEDASNAEVNHNRRKKTSTKTSTKKATTKKVDKKPKGPGVIVSILNAIEGATRDGISEEKILAVLVKLFPKKEESSMKNTIRAQIGTKKSPCRMEKERDITFKIIEKKEVRYFKIK